MDTQKPNPNSPRKIRERISEFLEDNLKDVLVEQRCPYTFVKIVVNTGEQVLTEVGFSKVSYPDVFSEKEGIRVARAKALAHLSKRIQKGDFTVCLPMSLIAPSVQGQKELL